MLDHRDALKSFFRYKDFPSHVANASILNDTTLALWSDGGWQILLPHSVIGNHGDEYPFVMEIGLEVDAAEFDHASLLSHIYANIFDVQTLLMNRYELNIGFALSKAKEMWGKLGDIPIDDNECIEEPFATFDPGTHREDIWHWFEDTFYVSVVDDLMHPKPIGNDNFGNFFTGLGGSTISSLRVDDEAFWGTDGDKKLAAKLCKKYPTLAQAVLSRWLLGDHNRPSGKTAVSAHSVVSAGRLIDLLNPRYPTDTIKGEDMFKMLTPYSPIDIEVVTQFVEHASKILRHDFCSSMHFGVGTLVLKLSGRITKDGHWIDIVYTSAAEFFGQFPFVAHVDHWTNMDDLDNHGDECPMVLSEALQAGEAVYDEVSGDPLEKDHFLGFDDCNCEPTVYKFHQKVYVEEDNGKVEDVLLFVEDAANHY